MTTLAAYYFPQYHGDPVNDRLHGAGWTEWDVLAASRPHFAGHRQPLEPQWGRLDESAPDVAQRKIDAAASAGIDVLIFDWYWYDGSPFLAGALERGFLAADLGDLRFAVMWANHPWVELYPARQGEPMATLMPAPNAVDSFRQGCEYLLTTYLHHPQYWRIDGAAYLSVYDIPDLLEGLGGIDNTRAEFDRLRRRAEGLGVGPLHLNVVTTRFIENAIDAIARLGADSATHYTWWHHDVHGFDTFPTCSYRDVRLHAAEEWRRQQAQLPVPYLPNVTMGWDPSPRTEPWDHDEERGYPYTSILVDNTPEEFGAALADAFEFADSADAAAVTINAFNEWTEGSYLEPDTVHGTAYLDAVRTVRDRRAVTRPT